MIPIQKSVFSCFFRRCCVKYVDISAAKAVTIHGNEKKSEKMKF